MAHFASFLFYQRSCVSIGLIQFVKTLLVADWAENIFFLAMQAMLVIRVYALFNRSKKVLIFLATSYILQATTVFVVTGVIYNKRVIEEAYTSLGPTVGSVEQSIQTNHSALPFINTLNYDSTILSIVFDIILLLFALWAFVKHTLEAKSLNGGWSINVLVRTLVADHLLYFICNLTWLLLSIATNVIQIYFLAMLLGNLFCVVNALVVVAGPRMVISLRTTETKTRGEGGTLEGEVRVVAQRYLLQVSLAPGLGSSGYEYQESSSVVIILHLSVKNDAGMSGYRISNDTVMFRLVSFIEPQSSTQSTSKDLRVIFE
ncbi:hypothetical protein BJ138DRAFT_1237836 [Hygrophoropsis aurantiaca]|uniref:Uncharacterized protein n=1 Tax=Hygrophoropsis aurantiaca TaxID=72124 RepID=A0ACB7ZTD3_9AGAM|nr:hypothetical protein BJ138DRAFT_1237836 [Hygrophoropsis aurantiaca]